MKTSQRGLAEIAAHEGIVLSKYKDSVGVWTIGIGHTKNAGAPDPMTIKSDLPLKDVMEIFARDIAKFEKRVSKAFKRKLTQSQFDAAVSFDFNTGGIQRASWVKLFNSGNDQSARRAFMKWRKPREIIPRRQAECDLFFDGQYSGDGTANVYSATSKGKVLWSSGRKVRLPELSQRHQINSTLDDDTKRVSPEAFQAKSLVNVFILIGTAATFVYVAFRKKIATLFQYFRRKL